MNDLRGVAKYLRLTVAERVVLMSLAEEAEKNLAAFRKALDSDLDANALEAYVEIGVQLNTLTSLLNAKVQAAAFRGSME